MADLPIVRRSNGDEPRPNRKPLRGQPLKYDKGYSHDMGEMDWDTWRDTSGEVAQSGIALGMPASIQAALHGKLGCGCSEAYLHALGDIVDGKIEADYMCDYGWHNYVVFEMEQMGKQQGLVVDKNGNLVETQDVGHGDTELGDY